MTVLNALRIIRSSIEVAMVTIGTVTSGPAEVAHGITVSIILIARANENTTAATIVKRGTGTTGREVDLTMTTMRRRKRPMESAVMGVTPGTGKRERRARGAMRKRKRIRQRIGIITVEASAERGIGKGIRGGEGTTKETEGATATTMEENPRRAAEVEAGAVTVTATVTVIAVTETAVTETGIIGTRREENGGARARETWRWLLWINAVMMNRR